MLEKKYEIVLDAPKAVSWDEYYEHAKAEYLSLLSDMREEYEKYIEKFLK